MPPGEALAFRLRNPMLPLIVNPLLPAIHTYTSFPDLPNQRRHRGHAKKLLAITATPIRTVPTSMRTTSIGSYAVGTVDSSRRESNHQVIWDSQSGLSTSFIFQVAIET